MSVIRRRVLLVLLVVATAVAGTLFAGAPAAFAAVTTLTPAADSYVQAD